MHPVTVKDLEDALSTGLGYGSNLYSQFSIVYSGKLIRDVTNPAKIRFCHSDFMDQNHQIR